MVYKQNGHVPFKASECAAESHGFAAVWGGHQLCSRTHNWVSKQELPQSLTGRHAKVYSLLDDSVGAAELRTYVHLNKWAVNPEKLAEFSKNKLVPLEAERYLHVIVNDEMPRGLKQYMELEFVFSNSPQSRTWNFTHHLGHLVDAGKLMEYGKNHKGYWNGEMFIKQLNEKIIPTFENIHRPGYQALFLIDDSQGHSAYAEDALLISRMNINLAGKQAHMRNG
ncbi:uncharacterized protein HD556DRAFT_1446007 [Suillus plorans]|uniref:Uncharacterized protein n=1 Tax=Suillus plorans TaxID=116603 RepID=A0A9P7DFP9_9AGAM|nr:uncharacterized protein HD556DRAFT_1446007 [Suillus plorans]KAG1790729.1 hypothetical protein HD556DRAFT_1446007 [Suillus plorans]